MAEGIVPAAVVTALDTVSSLEAGRTEAADYDPVEPVPQEHIDAVRSRVSRQVWGLIRLQLATGARPGELMHMRAVDLDAKGKVWKYKPRDHKLAYRGVKRVIYIGPKGQAVLREFMADRPVDAYLFSPRDAVRERAEKGKTHRRRNQPETPRQTDRRVRDHYDVPAYRRAIRRACEKTGIPTWHPNRLRHNFATAVREKHGIDVAQTILGHRLGSQVTEVYAAANVRKAVDAMKRIG